MVYQIYDPTVTEILAVDTYNDPSGVTYVADSTLAYWGGKYWCMYDGNVNWYTEGGPGQKNWLTTSLDGVTWTASVQPFRDSTYCNNPITYTGANLDWQPNLVVVGDELWCTWTGDNGYLSKLTSPTGKWTNYRFEFDGEDVILSTVVEGAATSGYAVRPTVNGDPIYYPPFFSQNPIVLSSGIVACPLTLTSNIDSTEIVSRYFGSFTGLVKFNALLMYEAGSWSMRLIDTSDFGDWVAWEPFVVENPVGHVYVFTRHLNDLVVPQYDFLLSSVSDDGGETFSSAVSTGMSVPSTRGFARQVTPHRWMMTHCDHPLKRVNGALFSSVRGSDDFVPGVNYSGTDQIVNYPQFCVGPDGTDMWVNYTSGSGVGTRRTLKIIHVDPLPDDGSLYVYPRSAAVYGGSPTDPVLVAGPPAHYRFDGVNQIWSTTAVTASTGITYAAWVRWSNSGDIIVDTRVSFLGQAFALGALSIGGINFTHGLALPPNTYGFLCAVINNSTDSIAFYLSVGGGSFLTVTQYYRCISFTGQPADGDTLTVNGVTYTFRNTPTLSTQIGIGVDVKATSGNARTAWATNSVQATIMNSGETLVALARNDRGAFSVSSGSSNITVPSGIPLDCGPASYGAPGSPTSSFARLVGDIYKASIYNSGLSLANITYLHNAMASTFGYGNITGTSTNPGSPTLLLDPGSPNPTEFPPLTGAAPGYCETVDANTLRIHGEEAAALDLPYGATQMVIRYKLGATPSGTDKYVIATFGTINSPARLYIDATNPTSLYCNGRFVSAADTPTSWSQVTVTVSTNKITIETFEQYFAGKPRCFLGNAYPETLLTAAKSIDYDVSTMTATPALRTP